MNDPQPASPPVGAPRDPPEGPAVLAERLFAGFTDEAEHRSSQRRRHVAPPTAQNGAGAAGIDVERRTEIEARRKADPELADLVAAGLAATDSIAEVVEVVGAQVDATAAELATLGQAMEQALEATNDRLAAIERALPAARQPGAGPAAAADRALSRLRTALRRSDDQSGQR